MTKNITKTKKSTLKTNIARLFLALVLVIAEATTTTLPALAAETTTNNVSDSSTVMINGVQYTTLIKQGQAQLTVGNKSILLSKENVMATVITDQNGTTWTISYSGRCAGYNYELQKNEPTVNLHTYVNNAEKFVTNGSYATSVQTTTGTVNLPTLEEFKKLAGLTSSSSGSSTNNGTTNNTNNGYNNSTSTSTTGNLNLVDTKKIGGKQYTIVVTNGTAQVVVDNAIRTITDKNIYEIAMDANGTILISTNTNGVKETRWCNPTLQTTTDLKTYLLASNPTCILKDTNGYATGVFANSSIVKVLTLDEQKKVLGIATSDTSTSQEADMSRLIPKGDYTYVLYSSKNKELTRFVLKNNILKWRGIKYKNVKRVGVIQKSKNLVVTGLDGSISIIDYDTMEITKIFTPSKSKGKCKNYSINSKGFTTHYVTTKGKRVSVKNK